MVRRLKKLAIQIKFEALNGTKDVKEVNDVKDFKDMKDIKPEASINALNDAIITNEKRSKTPELIGKEVITDPSNGQTSSSTGGKQNIADSVNTKRRMQQSQMCCRTRFLLPPIVVEVEEVEEGVGVVLGVLLEVREETEEEETLIFIM